MSEIQITDEMPQAVMTRAMEAYAKTAAYPIVPSNHYGALHAAIVAALSGMAEPVQDTWFTDRALPVMALSGDAESNHIIRMHFRRPVNDGDRKALCDALNLHQQSLAAPPVSNLREENERLRAALICIAHTFTEDSHGGTKSLPSSEYQDMARAALDPEGK